MIEAMDPSLRTLCFAIITAAATMIALILAVSVLLTLSIPLTESDALRPWFSAAYDLLTVAAATLAAFIVATIILLFQTMIDIIYMVNREFRDEN